VPADIRHWIYKLRNWGEYQNIKSRAFESPKGTFSLRHYTENRCIFVHVTKAAGTSVALSLFGELPYHYTAREYRVIYGLRDFREFFKFTFVRNPWDRLYSAYSYLSGGGWDEKDKHWAEKHLAEVRDFEGFVMDWLSPERLNAHIHFFPQSNFLCNNQGAPIVDYLGYFECVEEDFVRIAERLGVSASLMHTNKSVRTGYRSVYSEGMIEKVAKLYARDITNFGYRFDNLRRRTIINGKFVDL